MKENYHASTDLNFFKKGYLKIAYIFICMFFGNTYSQVSCYAFEESAGTYTALSSPTTVFASGWDDETPVALTIPFTFNFNNLNYTSFNVNCNGYITFGATGSAGNNFSPISTAIGYAGSISAFGRDLVSNASTIVKGVEGSAPNRVFVVQWNNARRYAGGSAIAGDNLNFQIRIYETTNKIDVVYGTFVATNTTSRTCEIGLRGATNADFNNISSTTAWNNFLRGSLNTSNVVSSNTLLPTSGKTFTWFPTSTISAPTSITASENAVCPGSTTTLTADGISTASSTLWFEGGCGDIALGLQWQTQPYTLSNAISNSVKNGILNITSTSSDANINIGAIGSFNSTIYKNLAVRYKVVSPINPTPGLMEVYYATSASMGLAEQKKGFKGLIADNNWHIINIDMTTNIYGPTDLFAPSAAQKWAGNTITDLRFDFCNQTGITMDIDYIVLTNRAVLENTNLNDETISVLPTAASTNYYAMRYAESTCLIKTACANTTIYKNKTWSGPANGDWDLASNWTPSGIPTLNQCIVITSGTPKISGTGYNASGKNITINTGTLTVNSSNSITITDAVNVVSGANFILENSASLIQDGTTNTNSGNIKVLRNTKPVKRYDFTYWSSPVSPQTMFNLSPLTLPDKYYFWNPVIQNWGTSMNGALSMLAGNGYIIRSPQTFDINTTTIYPATFTGVPNNGDVNATIYGNTSVAEIDAKWNLIGNPYPSAINLDLFLNDAYNKNVVNGTVYLWTHNSAPSSAIPGDATYNYTSNDYASYNLTGGAGTAAATPDVRNPASTNFNSTVPDKYLASGQGFFIKGKANLPVHFQNTMRVKDNNSQFFRNAQTLEVEKHRFWLNLRNSEGAFNQALIGYVEGASNDFDDSFDGEVFGGNYITLYSIEATRKLTIQGRAVPFLNTDKVALGYVSTIAGEFSISIDDFDGLFETQNIYLHDKLLNIEHNLKSSAYEFVTSMGVFDERFEIIYQSETLDVQQPIFNPNTIIVYKENRSIIINSSIESIDEIKVFDMQGRIIYKNGRINESRFKIDDLSSSNQVLIVQIKTYDGNKVSKKIIY